MLMVIKTLFIMADTCNQMSYNQQIDLNVCVGCQWFNKMSNHGETKEYVEIYRYSSNLE